MIKMKRDYILIKLNDGLKGEIEIHINDKVVIREIDNYKVSNANFGKHQDRIMEAIETGKFIREYQIKNNIEVHNPSCVVLPKEK